MINYKEWFDISFDNFQWTPIPWEEYSNTFNFPDSMASSCKNGNSGFAALFCFASERHSGKIWA